MMERIVKSSKRAQGFSLIEVLVAILLLAIVMLALLEAVTIYTRSNMTNILRDEAVKVTQDVLYDMRSADYSALTVGTTGTITGNNCTTAGKVVKKSFRYIVDFPYNVCWAVTEDSVLSHKTVTAVTSWTFQKQTFSHRASVVVSTF
jgi:prepilin-type N-terminal cleavage/methylation domain-containing protein